MGRSQSLYQRQQEHKQTKQNVKVVVNRRVERSWELFLDGEVEVDEAKSELREESL